jgi:hypothetical protein
MGTPRDEEIRERGTITFTPLNLRDMTISIKNKEFKTVTDLVNQAIRFYYENRDKPSITEEIEQYLGSEKGKAYVKDILKQVRESPK